MATRLILVSIAALLIASPTWCAWNELVESRGRRSKTYQDSENPNKYSFSTGLCTLHYESVIDSGNYDVEVDMTPVRVTAGGNDLWRVTQAGWHYALGQPSDKTTDGWVGFGGRKGQHWFKYRLVRVGYMHWPTRAWDDIGGAPTYNRSNLSSQIVQRPVGPDDTLIVAGSSVTWSSIWTTPGGGSLDLRWRVSGDHLKEDVIVNQAAREWIASNRPPSTPASDTYFGFVFIVDWSDIPKIVRDGVKRLPSDDFSDDGESIELRDSLDRLLAFMPSSIVYVGDDLEQSSETLRKRFYQDGSNHYLLVGVRVDKLNSMPSGDLVFDPTIDDQVGASDDDAFERGDETGLNTSITFLAFNYDGTDWWAAGTRFDSVTIPAGATIDTAYWEVYNYNIDDPNFDLHGHDVDNSSDFSTDATLVTRTKTTASVLFNDDDVGGGWYGSSYEIKSIIQELSDRGGRSESFPITLIGFPRTNSVRGLYARSYDHDTSLAAKLHIEYTAGGGGGDAVPAPRRIINVN